MTVDVSTLAMGHRTFFPKLPEKVLLIIFVVPALPLLKIDRQVRTGAGFKLFLTSKLHEHWLNPGERYPLRLKSLPVPITSS